MELLATVTEMLPKKSPLSLCVLICFCCYLYFIDVFGLPLLSFITSLVWDGPGVCIRITEPCNLCLYAKLSLFLR